MLWRIAVALGLAATSVLAEPRLTELTRIELTAPMATFGGLSGLEMRNDGTEAWAINDRARMFPLTFQRDQAGAVVDYDIGKGRVLRAPASDKAIASWSDTEGLVVDPNGRAFISLETPARIWVISPEWTVNYATTFGPAVDEALNVSGLEALAQDPQGRLVTIPEWPARQRDKTLPIVRQMADTPGWQIIAHVPRRGQFNPVGADFDDLGRFYLLERAVSLLGFRSRIRRFDLDAPDLAEEELLLSPLGLYDNLEALSVWRNEEGEARITLVSDNNFWHLQRTELIEFSLTE